MILVTGATGTVGSEVVKQLVEEKVSFRIFARNPEKAKQLAGPNADIVQGDFHNTEAIEEAMKGVDHLFMLSPSGPLQLDMEENIVRSAVQKGLFHIVKMSVMGASPFSTVAINRWHWESEKMIERYGILYTSIRPTLFMQDTLMFAPSISSEGKFYAPLEQGRVSMIDARDIASVAVAALIQGNHLNKIYEITGPEELSFNDIAEKISTAVGKTVSYVPVSMHAARDAMENEGAPDWLASDMVEYYHYFSHGYGSLVTPMVERITGKAPITFDKFAADYAQALTSFTG